MIEVLLFMIIVQSFFLFKTVSWVMLNYKKDTLWDCGFLLLCVSVISGKTGHIYAETL